MDTIIFSGNVGRDPEFKETDSYKQARFSVAVTHRVKGEKETEWRNVTIFGKSAEFVRDYVTKGRTVVVEGHPSVRVYKNKAGEPAAVMDVTASAIELIGSAARDGDGGEEPMPF